MTRQESLDFGDGMRVQEVVADVRRAIVDHVERMRHKEAAYVLDVSPSVLSKRLSEADRHQLSARDLVVLLLTGPRDTAKAVLAVLADAIGCEVDDAKPPSPEVFAKRLIESLKEDLAPAAIERHVLAASRRRSR